MPTSRTSGRWFSDNTDIRNDATVAQEVLSFIDTASATSVVMTDRIIGCPHEMGIDYEGQSCPACPFWAGRALPTEGGRHGP
jgi:hypothetical protein